MNDFFIECVKNNDLMSLNKIIYMIDISYDNNKALLMATSYNYYEILELLIDNKADINMNEGHLLPLAIMTKNPKIVNLLLNNGLIIKKYNLILSLCFNKINIFTVILKYINLNDHIEKIIDLSTINNNIRPIVEIIRSTNYYKDHTLFIQARSYINNLNFIYNKLLFRINKNMYNELNNNIISFIY